MEISLPLRELFSTPPELRSQRNLGGRISAPQNPQQLQGRGEIAPMDGLAWRHSEGDGQLEATRRLQTGQHQNPRQQQGRGEITPMERLARRHSEGDGQLEATRRLQTGQHLQRPKEGEEHWLTLRLQAEGRRAVQGQPRRSGPRPRTWDRLREELCTSVPHRKHTYPTRHSM